MKFFIRELKPNSKWRVQVKEADYIRITQICWTYSKNPTQEETGTSASVYVQMPSKERLLVGRIRATGPRQKAVLVSVDTAGGYTIENKGDLVVTLVGTSLQDARSPVGGELDSEEEKYEKKYEDPHVKGLASKVASDIVIPSVRAHLFKV
jgi:hypothetical protein